MEEDEGKKIITKKFTRKTITDTMRRITIKKVTSKRMTIKKVTIKRRRTTKTRKNGDWKVVFKKCEHEQRWHTKKIWEGRDGD